MYCLLRNTVYRSLCPPPPHTHTQFAQMLSSDVRKLQKHSRVTASYKLGEGLASTINEDLVDVLRTTYFSLNVDECMSNNYEKMFSVLSTFHSETQKSVSQTYVSLF